MHWEIRISTEARKEFKKLDNSIRRQVLAGILKVSKAPLPSPDGYGKPLGNKKGNNLTGFFKIKFKGIGIRVVYSLVMDKNIMNILVISPREDDYCYELAAFLYKKYGDSIFTDIFDKLI
ncbi:MAG: type II toxin-antitoxin system RelE/ParE family toxin [Pseudobutyrivibrio sp.]|nr:type II toxin-antitoxin system RelE/ParE family toxin [Pseudobutyrivibrio sp.]